MSGYVDLDSFCQVLDFPTGRDITERVLFAVTQKGFQQDRVYDSSLPPEAIRATWKLYQGSRCIPLRAEPPVDVG